MPTRRPSRTNSARDKNLPPVPTRARPGLAVDTSFSRHHGSTPKQVFPYESKTQEPRFVQLSDITSSGRSQKPSKERSIDQQPQLESKAYVAPSSQSAGGPGNVQQSSTGQQALHKRIKGLRPSPLDLTNDVSPSDRAITIGLAIPSAALSNRTHSPQSGQPYPQDSPPRYQEVATPTIVITPAKDDFEIKSADSNEGHGRRAPSSVYSRYTNGLARGSPPNQRTPPVPPLPQFAAASNKSLRIPARASAATTFEEDDSPPLTLQRPRDGLSICTVFEEQEDGANVLRRKNSQHVPTPRRSKGWWNVITSPFSAKSGAFSFRSPPARDDEDTDREPILSAASDVGQANRSIAGSQSDESELRSAPATDRHIQNFSTLTRTPKRSDTAPGAVDSGNARDVNIYRVPSKGEAGSYYDSKKNFPSMIGPRIGGRPRELEDIGDFDPRKSCFQASRAVGVASEQEDGTPVAQDQDQGMRDSVFYRIPNDGEAAEYYDSNRTFPSLVPYGWEYGSRELGDWTPRRSVMPNAADFGGSNKSFTESPSDMGDADADKAVPSGQVRVVERSPFESGQAAEFEGFTGTYGPAERKFFSTPSEAEMKGGTPAVPVTSRADPTQVQSPMSEATPVLEDAHMATYIGSKLSPKEVDIASTGAPTPTPAAPSNGLGNATMATREAEVTAPYPAPAPMSEKPPYPVRPQHVRKESEGLGISEDEAERGLFPPPPIMNEKSDAFSEYSEELPPRRTRSGCRWICCIIPLILGVLVAALVFLCVFLIPFPHVDEPVQAQWLALSGFPAIPTGISTVIKPNAVKEVSGCVSQQDLWTCAVPAREVNMAAPGQTDQPNFRFEIRFRNNTVPLNETVPIASNGTNYKRNTGQAAQAGALVRRTAWTNLLFSSSPAPPSIEDQTFIGRTTDKNNPPFEGEETPFYISLLEAAELTSNDIPGLQKRDDTFHYPYPTTSSVAAASGAPSNTASSQTSTSTTFASGPTNIPQQAIRTDGRPAPAVLYPFAYAQPLRLYNRGESTEHYGFYTYYDRTMYLSASSIATNSSSSSSLSGDIKPNVHLENANAVCTWSQTRLHFQIWTQKADVTSLSASQPNKISLMDSSANDMSPPGSFPYAVTVTLDRHGGDAGAKGVFCNSLNGEQQVTDAVRTWIAENRAFDGELVNPAAVPTNNGTMLTKRSDSVDIDGGSGGCACQWQNWE